MISDTDELRVFGRLPGTDKLSDDTIEPHLASASRTLAHWVGSGYESETDAAKIEAFKEAECCLAMAYLIPVLNTFYPQTATVLQKEIGETDMLFHSPGQLALIVKGWTDRARERVKPYIDDYTEHTPKVAWAAI